MAEVAGFNSLQKSLNNKELRAGTDNEDNFDDWETEVCLNVTGRIMVLENVTD